MPYARQISGIDITGNAHTWWHQAAGRYQRATAPERGAVLVFRSSGGMRLGHVSVVSKIVSSRHILVDHANWPGPGFPKGRVAHGVSVLDVSDRNDWTAVRVEIHGQRDGFGRVYPTFGFVLPRTIDDAPPPPLQPLTVARARVDERAARAAARPPAYVGSGTAAADALMAEMNDAQPARTTTAAVAAPAPIIASARAAQVAPAAVAPMPMPVAVPARVASSRAAEPVRLSMVAPRESLVDDDLLFAAPDRSLR